MTTALTSSLIASKLLSVCSRLAPATAAITFNTRRGLNFLTNPTAKVSGPNQYHQEQQQQQQQQLQQQQTRSHYTFNFKNNIIRYRRATRPRKTNDESTRLNYEQAQFAHLLGVTKSWNSWNTSNLLDSKRAAETARDDVLIRKFIYGTFHELLASEIIIKRRLNTINIGFLAKLPNLSYIQKVYFLCGYSEELLSCLLKGVVKIQPQTIYSKNDLIFRRW